MAKPVTCVWINRSPELNPSQAPSEDRLPRWRRGLPEFQHRSPQGKCHNLASFNQIMTNFPKGSRPSLVRTGGVLIKEKVYLKPPASAFGFDLGFQEPHLLLGLPAPAPTAVLAWTTLLGLHLSPYLLLSGSFSSTLNVLSSVNHIPKKNLCFCFVCLFIFLL